MKFDTKRPPKAINIRKIKIHRVDEDIFLQKGLFGDGCYGSPCDDMCCRYGCDVDYSTLKVILKNRKKVEKLIGARIEDCFSTHVKVDDDYIGGAYAETRVRKEDNICAFHLRGEKGCALFYLWKIKGVSKRIIPTICRTYPITWHRGFLTIDRPLRKQCKCLEKYGCKKTTPPSLYDTQKKEVHALFDVPKELLKPTAPKTKKGRR
ncbi:MAG: hypothetical protein OEV59_06780 [Deltaproteobacteria bacterium]|nr:hypothetical protein [Deltaproteobacteria bacterium]